MANLPSIVTDGKSFVEASSKKRFMVRGVALSPNSNADLLADNYSDYFSSIVLPKLVALNVNVIRVYQIDGSQPHAKSMKLLATHGCYVMVGLVTPNVCVNRMAPQYGLALYQRITSVAREFCTYANTLAFSVGNEVVFPGNIYANTVPANDAELANQIIKNDAAVMKSMVRDLKAYMRTNSLRMVPVGMAMQDGPSSTVSSWGGIGTDVVAQYYAGGDATQRADFVGINTYRYVNTDEPGPMNAYDGLANEVAALPVPVFLTESGGLFKDTSGKAKYPRDWKIVGQVYQEPLLYQNLSGQVAFQFFNKKEDMGLYTESPLATPNPFTASGSLATTTYGGANALATAFLNASSVTVPLASSVPDPSQCPSSCDPALLPCPGATISITVENYASKDLKAVQGGAVIADLPAGSQSTPSKTQVMVSGAANLLIQDPDGWLSVCQVVASKLSAGRVVRNNVAWGAGVACELS